MPGDLPVWFLPHSKAPTSHCKGIWCVQRPAGSPRSLPSAGHLGFRRRESLHVAPVVTRQKHRHGFRQAPQVTPAPQLLPSSGGRGTGPCTPHSCSLPPCPICARAERPGRTPDTNPLETTSRQQMLVLGPAFSSLISNLQSQGIEDHIGSDPGAHSAHLPALLPPGTWPSEGTGSLR